MSEPVSGGRYPLARPPRLHIETFAQRCGLHPDTVHKFVALGLLPCHPDTRGELWFDPSAVALAGRIQRLRVGLGLNYAAIGLVLDLLDRIEELESASRKRTSP
ncbi:MerR family transcriptional regulator [Mycobacterium sp. SM1]|uniref:chaperone modulator CbpM n=1 Tax=Mycobacterium sp. SM1 TaxID=2816243 RepID=UPI001BCCD447|nr:chaperone modulator CbpM [Mycobacterium sp. SM1]MBS4727802.1 MerR family transcriptional regulator [Mycobacterium sp. SM1]